MLSWQTYSVSLFYAPNDWLERMDLIWLKTVHKSFMFKKLCKAEFLFKTPG